MADVDDRLFIHSTRQKATRNSLLYMAGVVPPLVLLVVILAPLSFPPDGSIDVRAGGTTCS